MKLKPRPNTGQQVSADPTPEEIQQQCERIRRTSSALERRKRGARLLESRAVELPEATERELVEQVKAPCQPNADRPPSNVAARSTSSALFR